ncbi:MAG: hypothetical protein ABI130_02465 [Leifsonia sp.]
MHTATRLGLYAAGLAVTFGAAFTAAGVVVPKTAAVHPVATPTTAHQIAVPMTADQMGAMAQSPAASGASADARTVHVDGFDVRIAGDLTGGSPSKLTLSVAANGAPVTALESYAGAFGRLVALRDNDSAIVPVHPVGSKTRPGELGGPAAAFAVEAPAPGRYLLYFDFEVGGTVHTAAFALLAEATAAPQPDQSPADSPAH